MIISSLSLPLFLAATVMTLGGLVKEESTGNHCYPHHGYETLFTGVSNGGDSSHCKQFASPSTASTCSSGVAAVAAVVQQSTGAIQLTPASIALTSASLNDESIRLLRLANLTNLLDANSGVIKSSGQSLNQQQQQQQQQQYSSVNDGGVMQANGDGHITYYTLDSNGRLVSASTAGQQQQHTMTSAYMPSSPGSPTASSTTSSSQAGSNVINQRMNGVSSTSSSDRYILTAGNNVGVSNTGECDNVSHYYHHSNGFEGDTSKCSSGDHVTYLSNIASTCDPDVIQTHLKNRHLHQQQQQQQHGHQLSHQHPHQLQQSQLAINTYYQLQNPSNTRFYGELLHSKRINFAVVASVVLCCDCCRCCYFLPFSSSSSSPSTSVHLCCSHFDFI